MEEETYPCAFCGTGVVTRWTERGMVSDPNTELVADWVFHRSCWDGMVRENPTDASLRRMALDELAAHDQAIGLL